jgi:hypothetical protein
MTGRRYMKIDSLVANLRALLRANSIIADIHARHLVARTSLTGFAALIGAFGLVMLGLAAYLALEEILGPVWAAVSVGLVNCVIALGLVLAASRIRPGRDLELAREVHRTAIDALLADGRALETEIADFKQAFRNPLDAVLPNLIVPLADIIIKIIAKQTEERHEAKE